MININSTIKDITDFIFIGKTIDELSHYDLLIINADWAEESLANDMQIMFKRNIIDENTLFIICEGHGNNNVRSASILVNLLKEKGLLNKIIISDKYINNPEILKNINKKIYVISKNLDNILINKYSKQYSNVTFINNDLFHDRYIILDRKTVYVSGMSLKDLGKKYSYIYKMNEKIFINDLVSRIEILL